MQVGRNVKEGYVIKMTNYIDKSFTEIEDIINGRNIKDMFVQKDVLVFLLENYKNEITTMASWEMDRLPQAKKHIK